MSIRRPMCLICLIFLFGICAFTQVRPPKPSWPVDEYDKRSVTISGTVADRQEKARTLQVYLKEVSFIESENIADIHFPKRSSGIIVKFTENNRAKDHIRLGSVIMARGNFAPFDRAGCEGQFDARTYYMIRGYEGQLKRARLLGASKGYDHFAEALRSVRDNAFIILEDNMSAEDANLVAAMTLGDKSGLDPEIKDLYQNAGISHVLALSGLHIASVGLALLKILKKTGIPSYAASLISFAIIASYAVMTGMSTSTVRAMIMFGMFVLSSVAGRTYDLLSAAALSAILIIIDNPGYIYDSGFLLSFGAILGISCIYPVLADVWGKPSSDSKVNEEESHNKNIRNRLLGIIQRLYQSICISLSITLATLPVMGNSFMQISLCSVFINLLVIPLMSVVLLTGFFGMITGLLGINPAAILMITHFILRFYRVLGEISEKIDGNIFIIGKPERWQTVTYAIIVMIVVTTRNIGIFTRRKITNTIKNIDRNGRDNGRPDIDYHEKNANNITYNIEIESDSKHINRKKAGKIISTAVMLCVAVVIIIIHPRKNLEIRNVDVGQGDCEMIWGEGIPAVIIDGGSSDIKQVGKYRILPVLKANRIVTVDYCFLTHMDSDHVNGIIELLEDDACPVRIKNVVISEAAMESFASSGPEDNISLLINACNRAKTGIVTICAGDVIKLGGMRLICLSPKKRKTGYGKDMENSTDENENSIVLKLEYSNNGENVVFSGLFTGDIGEVTEKEIKDELEDVSYLKVAHHGSRYSTSEDFLMRTLPEVSVISSGKDNSYGHPHPETVQRLAGVGTGIFNTAESGEIIITTGEGKLHIRGVKQLKQLAP